MRFTLRTRDRTRGRAQSSDRHPLLLCHEHPATARRAVPRGRRRPQVRQVWWPDASVYFPEQVGKPPERRTAAPSASRSDPTLRTFPADVATEIFAHSLRALHGSRGRGRGAQRNAKAGLRIVAVRPRQSAFIRRLRRPPAGSRRFCWSSVARPACASAHTIVPRPRREPSPDAAAARYRRGRIDFHTDGMTRAGARVLRLARDFASSRPCKCRARSRSGFAPSPPTRRDP